MAPIQVFILAGQSNMVGMGAVKHLRQLIDKPETPNEYRETLWNADTKEFRVRENVYMKNDATHGLLTVAPGYAAENCFGPELMFGWTVADALLANDDSKILLIKTSWGGKSLTVDFRPPSSGMPPDGKNPTDTSHVGVFYRKMIQEVKDTLGNLSTIIPGYTDEMGYDLRGFVWFQGWNDMLTWPTANEYVTNLANLIRDVRHDLQAPQLLFVIGELGQHGPAELMDPTKRWTPRVLAFRKHQYEVTQQPEFLGNTIFAKTAEFMVFGQETFNQAFHYNGRADTFFHIGRALGQGMLQLLGLQTAIGQCPALSQVEETNLAEETSSKLSIQ
jgi:hypothetical protein